MWTGEGDELEEPDDAGPNVSGGGPAPDRARAGVRDTLDTHAMHETHDTYDMHESHEAYRTREAPASYRGPMPPPAPPPPAEILPPPSPREVQAAREAREAREAHAARRARRSRRRPLAWCGGLLLAVVSAPLAFRALDADGPTPLPQLLAFLPWFLVPGWVALLCGVLSRRTLLVLWAVAVLAGTGLFLRPYGPDAPAGAAERPSAARFRVLTANLEFGGATRPLVETVRRERPQFVSVQECDERCAAALRTPEMREAYPHRIIDTGGDAEGSALLSTYPLRSTRPVPGSMAMPGAVAEVAGRPVRVQVAHPMPPVPGSLSVWRNELSRLRSYAAARGDAATVIAGDFNSSQDHAAFRRILDTGMHDAARMAGQSRTPTWPTRTAPPLGAQIDHVLLSKTLTAVDARFLDLPGTDHRALLADVKLF